MAIESQTVTLRGDGVTTLFSLPATVISVVSVMGASGAITAFQIVNNNQVRFDEAPVGILALTFSCPEYQSPETIAILTRASQESVDGLVASMGPAITAGTQDKLTTSDFDTGKAALTSEATANKSSLEAAILTRASQSSFDATLAALLVEVTARGMQAGQITEFLTSSVPANHTKLAATDYVPAGGIAAASAATSTGQGLGDVVWVATGQGAGIWRFRKDRFQRYDPATNAAVGNEVLCPTTNTSTYGAPVACVVIGTSIYVAGVVSGATPTATNKLYALRTDQATPYFDELASFPRALCTTGVCGVAISATKILFTAGTAVGLATSQALTPFWIYDITTNAAPTEQTIALPITKFSGSHNPTADFPMQLMPDGKVLVVDVISPTSGNFLSCLLTISAGGVVSAGAAMDTGIASLNASGYVIPTATGALMSSTAGGAVRAYTHGMGWGPGSSPVSYGTVVYGMRSRKTSWGWLNCANTTATGALPVYVAFTSSPLAGVSLSKASKNPS